MLQWSESKAFTLWLHAEGLLGRSASGTAFRLLPAKITAVSLARLAERDLVKLVQPNME